MKRFVALLVVGVMVFSSLGSLDAFAAEVEPNEVFAAAISSPVLVNGVEIEFEAYTINGFNHFRLRDLAYVLSGTEAQFDVAFNYSTNTAYILTGLPYTVAGGEMTGNADGWTTTLPSLTNFVVDGDPRSMIAFNIEGNNFFRLRAIAFLLDFSVEWIDETVVIETSGSFVSEGGDPAEMAGNTDRGVSPYLATQEAIDARLRYAEERIPQEVIADRENIQNSELTQRDATPRQWTREELELRKQRFVMQGIEVPQDLLDLLAELD